MTTLERIEAGSKIVGIVGALIAAIFALAQARLSLAQRREDLRWKQAEVAKKVVDEWFDWDESRDALLMIEPRKRRYVLPNGESHVIEQPDVLKALSSTATGNDVEETFIQDCFDALFYYFERTEQFLMAKLILFPDVQRPAEYYIGLMSAQKNTYRTYAQSIGYSGALAFLDRFKAWSSV
jgi:hypothetical protein